MKMCSTLEAWLMHWGSGIYTQEHTWGLGLFMEKSTPAQKVTIINNTKQ